MVETTTRDFRGAFTLIEIIVSVTIISIVVIGAMKLQDRSRDMAIYIQERGKSELDNLYS